MQLKRIGEPKPRTYEHKKGKGVIGMIPDMAVLKDKANELGYRLVRYDELEKKVDEVLKYRYMLVFEKGNGA